MNSYRDVVLKSIIENKRYSVITEYMNIIFPDIKEKLIVDTYNGSDVRLFKNKGDVNMLIPSDISTIQESNITSSILNGTIFDDADKIDDYSKYIELTTLPYNGMVKNNRNYDNLHIALSSVIGKYENIDDNFDIDDVSMKNGKNFLFDSLKHKEHNQEMIDIIDNYLGNENGDYNPLGRITKEIEDEIESINDISNEDCITEDDYEYIQLDDDYCEDECFDKNMSESEMFMKQLKEELKDDNIVEEGFITKRPKKLKPIPRDIISYITVEMNAIQDANDQAMLSGYTCSKLELVDFYLNVIDTNDVRYIVPHDRNYLVNLQNQLNNLLTQILKIRPVNKTDRVWKVNVTYPEGWNG